MVRFLENKIENMFGTRLLSTKKKERKEKNMFGKKKEVLMFWFISFISSHSPVQLLCKNKMWKSPLPAFDEEYPPSLPHISLELSKVIYCKSAQINVCQRFQISSFDCTTALGRVLTKAIVDLYFKYCYFHHSVSNSHIHML